MKTRPFKQVDVFTDTPYLGNPLAVVLDGTGLSDEEMQHFAQWTNLSETTFVLPPSAEAAAAGADYQLRIFTTAYEMPFAGHPTLGSCHAWLEHGGAPKQPELIVQQCKVGLVRIRRSATQLAFAAPALTRSQPEPEAVAGAATGSGLIKRSNREARAFDFGAPAAADVAPSAQPQVEVRFFANDVTLNEDPVTGSFNASLAQWLIADGLAPSSYIAAQGTCLGRAGRVHIEQDATGQVWVGGESVTCIDGHVKL